jgi:perosamine synthetase
MGLEFRVGGITKENIIKILPSLMSLEHNWTEIGDSAWTRENFTKDLPGKWGLSKCVYYDGKVIGYFMASADGLTLKLNKILVDKDYRGTGAADLLWQEFLESGRRNGLETAEFKVLTDNDSAINFYRKRGCLFDGDDLGSDGLVRHVVVYPFKLKDRINHSKPTILGDDKETVLKALQHGELATGNIVENFTRAFGSYIGKKYGVATCNGTAALHLALRALDVKEGDDVILPSFVCNSVLNAVKYCNAHPSLVDINPDDYNMSLEDAKKVLIGSTKAIIVPHMFGKPVRNLEDFITLDVPVIEDCALSVGASHDGKKVGSFGDLSIFSFRATKMLAAGLGGMVLTDDEHLYERLKDLTAYDNRAQDGESYNYQMSDLNAALALSQLKKLEGFVWARKMIAKNYTDMFKKSSVDFEFPNVDDENIFFRYIIRHPRRDDFMENVRSRGVEVAKPVFMPLHMYLNLNDSDFPNTMKAYDTAVSIPIYPNLTEGIPTSGNKNVRDVAGILTNWRYEK